MKGMLRLTARSTVIDFIGHILAGYCKLQVLLLGSGVLGLFGKLSVFDRLFSVVIGVVWYGAADPSWQSV